MNTAGSGCWGGDGRVLREISRHSSVEVGFDVTYVFFYSKYVELTCSLLWFLFFSFLIVGIKEVSSRIGNWVQPSCSPCWSNYVGQQQEEIMVASKERKKRREISLIQ